MSSRNNFGRSVLELLVDAAIVGVAVECATAAQPRTWVVEAPKAQPTGPLVRIGNVMMRVSDIVGVKELDWFHRPQDCPYGAQSVISKADGTALYCNLSTREIERILSRA